QDLLTGLYNRQYFMDQLTDAVNRAASNKGNSVLFYIEPENFKTIKDTLGIAGSDIVLADIASLLKDSLPSNVMLARFAGTIFTALFPNTTIDDVLLMADQILESFSEKLFEIEGKTVSTTCSIGITQITETTPDSKKVLSNADAASILAKEKKDKHLHIHTVADELAGMEQDKEWANRIQFSLTKNRFILHYQPIVSLHAEPGERYEVLIRMLDSEDKLIMPNEFLEAAEHSGLMTEIDRWVMKNAAKALLEKRRSGNEVRLFIKLSYDSLVDPTLLPWISKLLKAARLHGSSFVFEVSEAIVSNNIKAVKIFIAGLRQLHCLFNIDHIGSESDNLNYLNHFDTDYLKIDGQHIQKITSSEDSQLYIKTITEMARSKEILTIAEHVEDPACLAILWQHGVNFIQGQYLQHPGKSLNYDFTAEE
ncbi:MAG: EAL domain-containing protein, partial [Thiohalomonadales bacterium]